MSNRPYRGIGRVIALACVMAPTMIHAQAYNLDSLAQRVTSIEDNLGYYKKYITRGPQGLPGEQWPSGIQGEKGNPPSNMARLDKKSDRAAAMSNALANVRFFFHGKQKIALGASVGFHNQNMAFGVGFGTRLFDKMVLRSALAADSDMENLSGGVGILVNF